MLKGIRIIIFAIIILSGFTTFIGLMSGESSGWFWGTFFGLNLQTISIIILITGIIILIALDKFIKRNARN